MDYDKIVSNTQATRYVVNFMYRTGLLQQFQYVTPDEGDDEPTGFAAMNLVADNYINRPTQRGLRQSRRDRRRGEILGEAIGIMRWVFIVIGRFASTHQSPPAHLLWRVELRMLVLIHQMLALRWEENNDPVDEEEVLVLHS
ncbi:hypothetical protein PENPOL_c002G04609 [Penicillium polonicum]|uniref:Uncharacterized protein n=1 Tax=Penicillium polonicum TaxID=60169 RepID=A0A1V6NXR5_PENPO|nr:hypothetical protein PENPOL_c002G04609 [Penicillium polonicum]